MSRSTREPFERLTSASTSPLLKWTTLSTSMLLYGSPQREIGMCSINLSPRSPQPFGLFEIRGRYLAVKERHLDELRRAAPDVPLRRRPGRRHRFERAADADRPGNGRTLRHVEFHILFSGAAEQRLHVGERHPRADLVVVFLR